MTKSLIKLKICGITQTKQALEIASLGVEAIGVIAVKGSPRYISSKKRKNLFQQITKLHPSIKRVLVVADINDDDLKEALSGEGTPSVVQLHGNESIEKCDELRKKYPHIELWKAFRIGSKNDLNNITRYEKVVNFLLLDAWSEYQLGGTGKRINLELITGKNFSKPYWIAGGISDEWIPDLIKTVKPFGIDVSSKVEKSPGIKDIKKIKNIIKAIENIQK